RPRSAASRYCPCDRFKALSSDSAYARLVYVAPETMSTRADCAWIASERRIGAEYWLIRADRERSLGSWSASTSRSLPPDTAISTWTGPNCVSTVAPVNGVPPAAAMLVGPLVVRAVGWTVRPGGGVTRGDGTLTTGTSIGAAVTLDVTSQNH